MKKRLWISTVFMLHVSLLILLAACGRKAAPEGEPTPVPPVNNFTMKNLASEFPGEIRTAKHADKVQLILFLRTDDPACRGSIPGWNEIQKEFAARGFTIIGAVVDDRLPAAIAAEVATLDLAWPVGLADAPIVAAFGGPAALRAIPTAFLLGREGVLLRTYAGHEPLPDLRDDIACALDGQELPNRKPQAVLPEDNTP